MSCPFFKGQSVSRSSGLRARAYRRGRALIAGGANVIAGDGQGRGARSGAEGGVDDPKISPRSSGSGARPALILSPGVPLTASGAASGRWQKQRKRGPRSVGDVEAVLSRRAQRRGGGGAGEKLFAVTGTNGKSTTTALIGHLLSRLRLRCGEWAAISASPCSNSRRRRRGGLMSWELSSYQLDLTAVGPGPMSRC